MNAADLHPLLRQSVFIAGTDTSIGKTWVATRLLAALGASGLRAAGMKPVAAGAEMTSQGWRNDDALELAAAANVRLPYELVNPVCLPDATSPHLAAARAGVAIDLEVINRSFDAICLQSDVIVVEGAGGWHAPIAAPATRGTPGPTMQDVALRLGLPVVLVVGLRLGCLNHALLTAGAIRASGLLLAGWIANPVDPEFRDGPACRDALLERLPCPLLWSASAGILPSQ